MSTGLRAAPRVSRIKGFDGLRGLAAVAVFLHHKANLNTYLGYVAVNLFFTLSGFLIIGILMRRRRMIEAGLANAWQELGRFWSRRSIRLFPIYYLLLATMALVWWWICVPNENGFGWYFAYAQNFYIGFVGRDWGRICHLWSLATEEQFYLIAAPLFLLVASRFHRIAALSMVAISVVSSIVCAWLDRSIIEIFCLPLINFGLIAVGALLAIEHERSGPKMRIGAGAMLTGSGALVAACLANSILLVPGYHFGAMQLAFGLTLVGCPLLVGYVFANPNSLLTRGLELAPLRLLGIISYGFYLYHFVLPLPDEQGRLISYVVASPSHALILWSSLTYGVALTIAVASASYFFIEAPIMQWKDKIRFASYEQPSPKDNSATPIMEKELELV